MEDLGLRKKNKDSNKYNGWMAALAQDVGKNELNSPCNVSMYLLGSSNQ